MSPSALTLLQCNATREINYLWLQHYSMYSCSPIQGKRSLQVWKLRNKYVPYFQEELGPCSLDWRTMIQWNVSPTFFQQPWHMRQSWIIVGTTFQCMVVFQSRRQYSNSFWHLPKSGCQSLTNIIDQSVNQPTNKQSIRGLLIILSWIHKATLIHIFFSMLTIIALC